MQILKHLLELVIWLNLIYGTLTCRTLLFVGRAKLDIHTFLRILG